MIIGLTYDLRQTYLDMGYSEIETAELDSIETVEALDNALQKLGHTTVRIGNAKELIVKLVNGERWDIVFNITEGIKGVGREAQVPSILELYDIPYTFSDPMVMSLTLHKGMTKRIVRDAGLLTADFQIVREIEDIDKITFAPPFFVKPIAEGTGKGIADSSVIMGRDFSLIKKNSAQKCSELIESFKQPVLVEKFLSGREFTVGISGTGKDAEVVGTMEIMFLKQTDTPQLENKQNQNKEAENKQEQPKDKLLKSKSLETDIYSFENKEGWEDKIKYRPLVSDMSKLPTLISNIKKIKNSKFLFTDDDLKLFYNQNDNSLSCKSVKYKDSLESSKNLESCSSLIYYDALVDEVEKLALESWQVLECRDGGRVDIRCDENGKPCFMEVNPLAGLRPEYSDLPILCSFFNISYLELIEQILKSASKRIINLQRVRNTEQK